MPVSGDRVIGVHPVEAAEPCHLVELFVESYSPLELVGGVTQERPGEPRDSWQVPWDERVLDADGESELRGHVQPPCRVAFFFHYLDRERPLRTPFGPLRLPMETERPERLAFMEYEAP